MKPIQGAEFDLDERSIQQYSAGSTAVEICRTECSALQLPAPCGSSSDRQADSENDDADIKELKECIQHDHIDMTSIPSTKVICKYPNLIFPSGPLKKRSHSHIYTSLFKMVWGEQEKRARWFMTYLRKNPDVSVDLKIVSMEVVHTVNGEKDFKMLTSALAYTDRRECENTSILKCRLHRRLAGLHYRNNDLDDANEHMETALQLAHNIGPDIDTIYTNRLKALMLFEDYKKRHKAVP